MPSLAQRAPEDLRYHAGSKCIFRPVVDATPLWFTAWADESKTDGIRQIQSDHMDCTSPQAWVAAVAKLYLNNIAGSNVV
jgi:hypothetical protein